ncbi:motility protein A [Alicyclobacillus cellulosilyticus]|uniref:Motility protein A n=1 Tax=Alicyclobacillus cellulosilyticus TaxID=1003997 RepID=A0A917KBL1_9BACL|nr:flagellar motor protein [Alicyclobacillus cellulosilyticus]GGJ05857.1 motility protein A [Alicyclobacillus cellulosilyticus]
MDFATALGIVLAIASLAVGFTLDGGSLVALWQPNALIIIFGGTIGATLTSVSFSQFAGIGAYLRHAFFQRPHDPLALIDQLVRLAQTARREGILALEEQLEAFDDSFLRNGIQWVVDGVDPELVRQMLETELAHIEERHEAAASIFETAGGFAPTMGIIGTVMGLVHVLGNLKNVDALGPQIATAFTATLYGVASANVLWLPLANKLRRRNAEEVLLRQMMIEGVLSIQAGENPNILSQKLKAFLAPSQRTAKRPSEAREMGQTNASTV